MSNILMRLILAVIAGATYLAGVIPADATAAYLQVMPLSIWLMFVVNLLTAFASPSIIRKSIGMKKL